MTTTCAPQRFGALPDGREVELFTLSNASGASVDILNYGGVVTALRVPDRDGNHGDVVLGFADLSDYPARHPYFGAIIGRVAGRIHRGRIRIDGRNYQLPINNAAHHLHGGFVGLDQRIWNAEPLRVDGNDSLRLTYRSPDGEEGYPGSVDFTVSYTLTATNDLVIESAATTDRPTPVSLTHHSYFNLAGEGAGTIADHELAIFADETAPADDTMSLLDRRAPVVAGVNDFNQPRRLGDALPHLFKSHGDLYFVRRPADDASLMTVARVSEPGSGRVLEVRTTETCLQLYSAVDFDGTMIGKSGRPYPRFAGLCLECEGYPEGTGKAEFGDITLRPGETRRHTTIYSFSTDILPNSTH